MIRHLYSKLAITIYVLILIGLCVTGYLSYKKQNAPAPSASTQQNQSSTSSPASSANNSKNGTSTDNTLNTATNNAPTDNSSSSSTNSSSSSSSSSSNSTTAPVSATPTVTGSMLAHITPQHCADNCQAFAIDLKLFEYCQQVCGISPVKKVTSCDDQSGIQKDYCLKDLAITKEDSSQCEKIADANVKATCKNRITQDMIENRDNSGTN